MASQVIPKDKMKVRFYTREFIIEGIVYLPKGGTLPDYINVDRKFISVTEVVIRSLADGREIQKKDILLLNHDSVILVLPEENEKNKEGISGKTA